MGSQIRKREGLGSANPFDGIVFAQYLVNWANSCVEQQICMCVLTQIAKRGDCQVLKILDKMFRFSNFVRWRTENKNLCRISVRHCSKFFKSSLKNIQVAGKRVIFYEARSIKRSGSTNRKQHKNNFCRILNQVQARVRVLVQHS